MLPNKLAGRDRTRSWRLCRGKDLHDAGDQQSDRTTAAGRLLVLALPPLVTYSSENTVLPDTSRHEMQFLSLLTRAFMPCKAPDSINQPGERLVGTQAGSVFLFFCSSSYSKRDQTADVILIAAV